VMLTTVVPALIAWQGGHAHRGGQRGGRVYGTMKATRGCHTHPSIHFLHRPLTTHQPTLGGGTVRNVTPRNVACAALSASCAERDKQPRGNRRSIRYGTPWPSSQRSPAKPKSAWAGVYGLPSRRACSV
jgi:hypothetical protein